MYIKETVDVSHEFVFLSSNLFVKKVHERLRFSDSVHPITQEDFSHILDIV
jgi:hypothetical protein